MVHINNPNSRVEAEEGEVPGASLTAIEFEGYPGFVRFCLKNENKKLKWSSESSEGHT